MSRVQPARRVALEVIRAVEQDDAYANLLLPQRIAKARLDAKDAGLATELTYGTLRMQGYYDRVIELAARRPTAKIDPAVLDVLRLGTHQLLATRVASHAAVDESVTQVRDAGKGQASGFVNGVLRTISRDTPESWRARVLDAAEGVDARLAAEFSHPEWVVRALRGALAAEGRADELGELLAADNVPPRVSLVALPGLDEPGAVAGVEPGRWSPVAVTAPPGDPAALPSVKAGKVRVQDEGSQLAALALSRVAPITAGERWLDMCAGPGGKAALLAAEAQAGGATLVANELVPGRVGLVRQALAASGLEGVEVRQGDAAEIGAQEPASYDRILLDAPCTGLGALRRRPEARWRKQPRDVADLAALQVRLLASGLAALKPGGTLAYVTCSPHLAETRAIVDGGVKRFARDGGDVTLLDAPAVLGGIATAPLDLGPGPFAQLWPHRHATDAMFISLLVRG
ncbi:RsmB/NOP family class I SAM-dependent RNA methyltransferase [Frondihabitans australicus]|uniref:16S rRNA (Cytosine967-C5)-methyltransferase n=1 Tax=Frondihabitans australicus TaxID=386892 RepID=A0A495IGB4_9MICO|nr:transcription antitermination factor NusB [Frondihabitans australicus]RKR74116.1 16S rRNA (cytosine967-C5)-methyltransferase [Frondihabitans australicus]